VATWGSWVARLLAKSAVFEQQSASPDDARPATAIAYCVVRPCLGFKPCSASTRLYGFGVMSTRPPAANRRRPALRRRRDISLAVQSERFPRAPQGPGPCGTCWSSSDARSLRRLAAVRRIRGISLADAHFRQCRENLTIEARDSVGRTLTERSKARSRDWQALAASLSLRQGDFAEFQRQAEAAARLASKRQHRCSSTAICINSSPITRVPFGSLPKAVVPKPIAIPCNR